MHLIQKYWYQLIFFTGIPMFFLGFTMLYDTLGIKEEALYGGFPCSFHVTMLMCIAVIIMAIMRTIFWFINRNKPGKWWEHMLWCLGETYAVSYFFALYLSLFSGRPYFECLLDSMGYTFLCFMYPYIVLILAQVISDERLEAEHRNEADEIGKRVRFFDDRKKLRLTLDKSTILMIQADYNYVKIYYQERGEAKNYILRTSMKSIGEQVGKYGLVRCHRSYFVNPEHVQILSRDKFGGMNATLDCAGMDAVPVTKKYFAALSELL